MSTYRYAVKVSAPRLATRNAETWTEYEIHCQGCLGVAFYRRRRRALRFARKHAATCEDLHRLNWAAACLSVQAQIIPGFLEMMTRVAEDARRPEWGES